MERRSVYWNGAHVVWYSTYLAFFQYFLTGLQSQVWRECHSLILINFTFVYAYFYIPKNVQVDKASMICSLYFKNKIRYMFCIWDMTTPITYAIHDKWNSVWLGMPFLSHCAVNMMKVTLCSGIVWVTQQPLLSLAFYAFEIYTHFLIILHNSIHHDNQGSRFKVFIGNYNARSMFNQRQNHNTK